MYTKLLYVSVNDDVCRCFTKTDPIHIYIRMYETQFTFRMVSFMWKDTNALWNIYPTKYQIIKLVHQYCCSSLSLDRIWRVESERVSKNVDSRSVHLLRWNYNKLYVVWTLFLSTFSWTLSLSVLHMYTWLFFYFRHHIFLNTFPSVQSIVFFFSLLFSFSMLLFFRFHIRFSSLASYVGSCSV